MKHRPSPSYFLRLLISYLLVLFLPTAFIYLLFSDLLFKEMKTRIEADNDLLSYTFEENIRNVMEACDGVIENLSYYHVVVPFALTKYPSRAIDLKDSLQKYMVTNDVMDEIGVYFRMDHYIYTNKSSYRLENYIAYQEFKEEYGEAFLELIKELREPCFFKGEKRNGGYALLYIRPYLFESGVEGAIWFVLNQDELERLMADRPGNTRKTALFDATNMFLLGELPEGINRDTITMLLSKAEAAGNMVSEEREYRIEVRTMPEYGLYYVQAVPDRQLYARLEEERKKYLFIMGVVMLAGGLIMVGLSRRLYRPIRMLKKLIPDSGKEKGNEFRTFESAYTDLKEKNEALYLKVHENVQFHQRYLLNCLINGSYLEQEDFKAEAEDCGLNISCPWWCMLIDSDRQRSREELETVLRSWLFFSCLYLCIEQEDCRVFMLGMEEKPDAGTLFPEGLLASSPVATVFELSDAYAQIRILSERKSGESQIDSGSLSQYEEEIDGFGRLLEKGEWSALIALTDDLAERMCRQEETAETKKLVYYRIIRVCQRNQYWKEDEQKGNELADKILMAPNMAELDLLTSQKLLQMLQMLKKETQKPSLSIEKVKKYVEEHYFEADFSLKMVADYFGVSVSYISQFFKNVCGSKLIDYYTNLRMERVKELMGTDMGLQEIMLQVGYFNMSSFIRRFKQLYGMTPGEYRSTLHRKTGKE